MKDTFEVPSLFATWANVLEAECFYGCYEPTVEENK